MAKRRLFDFSTAYAQLILLVFLPISALAVVGAVLVFRDTSHAARIEQQANANTAISRYESVAYSVKDSLIQLENSLIAPQKSNKSDNKTAKPSLSAQEKQDLQNNLKTIFQTIPQDHHVLGMAVIDEKGQTVVSTGNVALSEAFAPNWQISELFNQLLNGQKLTATLSTQPTAGEAAVLPSEFGAIFGSINNPSTHNAQDNTTSLLSPVPSQDGSLYGKKIFLDSPYSQLSNNSDVGNDKPLPAFWLVVNIDDEPLKLARLQVMYALAVTGLLTILLLLLSLNVYARRWISPIYEMRLHLQRTNATNLYKPMNFTSSGEINQLQQDLTKTLRRLHTSFQELKNHAEQTEDDLRLAFDEMEMQNISIRNARDAAVSASQLKSAFLANISHELRTPLNSIDGFINLLARHGGEKGGLTAEQNLYVQTIRKSSAHLLALVNDVLDFSKIEAGKLVLDTHEFDLYASIYDVVDMLSPLAAEKQLNLAVFFYDDVPRYLLGDALRVKQVLTNLVNNAIKFTDTGEVVVRVSLDDYQDDTLRISVQDTGKGVPAEQQGLLFQSFSQGDPSITRQYGGTGLGLVISKQLTQLMGGKIDYQPPDNENNDSPDGQNQGSIFWFTLPIRLSSGQQQQALMEGSVWELPKIFTSPEMSLAGSNGKMQILVWLMHTASLQVLKGSLNQLPVQVTTVFSLTELLISLKEGGNRWDWVIIDSHTTVETTAILKQIRLDYAGKLALFGYQINLDNELLTRYQVKPLYQPLDRRQLYQLLGDDKPRPPSDTLPKWQGFRVLAVDDHFPNLLVLEALLAELKIDVVTANSGYEAIDYIQQYQSNSDKAIDLIFMDIQMPKMSGQEAATQIRQLENPEKRIPIIALTAHSLSDEKESLLASGIDDYVGKPISQAQLLQILQTWLGKQSVAETAGQSGAKKPLPKSPLDQNTNATFQHKQAVTDMAATRLANKPDGNFASPFASPFNSNFDSNADSYANSHADNSPNKMTLANDRATEHNDSDRDNIHQQTPDLPVIDWDDALMRAAGKADLASNLMIMLIDSIDQEKSDLEQAWQAHDRQALANIAHRILGASRYTGVPALRQASQNFEDKCLLNVQNASPAQFAMLMPHFEQLLEALNTLKHTDLSPWSHLYYSQLKEQDMPWKMM